MGSCAWMRATGSLSASTVCSPSSILQGSSGATIPVPALAGRCEVHARTTVGAMYGLTTLAQAVEGSPGRRLLLGAPLEIHDAPRFPHRGLLLDTARHFLPLAVLLRAIDAMSRAKMNVLHWHLSDAQSFPLQSRRFPELAKKAAYAFPAATFEAADVKRLLSFARSRGVRVLPEFDVPGHGAWGKAFPELMACPDTLDPTSDSVYAFLAAFLEEVSTLFERPSLIFLGGDEVSGKRRCWGPRN